MYQSHKETIHSTWLTWMEKENLTRCFDTKPWHERWTSVAILLAKSAEKWLEICRELRVNWLPFDFCCRSFEARWKGRICMGNSLVPKSAENEEFAENGVKKVLLFEEKISPSCLRSRSTDLHDFFPLPKDVNSVTWRDENWGQFDKV